MPLNEPSLRVPTSTDVTPPQPSQLQHEGRPSGEARPSSSIFRGHDERARRSSGSDSNYPSWLPRRPSKPVPRSSHDGLGAMRSSNETSSSGMPDSSGPGKRRWAHKYGRKPTQRAVRVVAMPPDHSDPVGLSGRSRSVAFGTRTSMEGSGELSPRHETFNGNGQRYPTLSGARPRFRAPGLHLELAQHPSMWNRLLFILFPIIIFAHIPIQAFLDYNAAFMLFQVAKHPTASAPGVPASGRGWAFAFGAYLACYLIWLFVIFLGYEIIYSFYRRWRANRPLILPIYLSVPASNLVSMRSYSHFCFMQYIRFNAFRKSDDGSISNGIAEQCYRFSQNLPTVILLLPRAAMCLALLLAFSSPGSAGVASGNAGSKPRDATYFNGDGALTSYGRGILIFNAVWIAWRVLVLLASWIGLWILSGQGCAGFCGPRYRWEELDDSDEKAEENPSAYYLQRNESVVETWPWLPFTAARIQDAFDLCLISRPKRATSEKTVAELESERRHSKAPSLPHELPPMKQISGEFAVIPSRKPSDAEPSGLRTIPASPQTPATPAGGVRAPLLQAPEAAAVVPMLGAPSASAARRSILDDGVFSRYGAARTSSKPSTPPDGTEKANGSRPPSLWAGATVENDLPKGKGKERASLHSQRPRPQEEEDAPLPSSSLVPPYPYLGETAGAVAPLPFPLRPADDQAQGDDLTPPQGSDASAEHVVDEDEDDTAGLDLEGFVVGEDDDDDVDEEDTEQQQQHQQQQPVQSPRGPRVSDENGGSGSISSLGQPIAPSFPLLAGDSIPRRSQSVGSTGSPLSHRFPSGVDEEGRWSFSPPHSSAAGSAGVRSRAGSQPGVAGASLDPPPRHPSAGSSVHRRRTRADTVPSPLASSQSSDERSRLRTISMQDQTFGVQIPLPPVQGTDDDDILDVDDYDADLQVITEERKEGTVEDEGRGASLDEGEREDSVGLLSQGPSPKSSIGVLRSRANSLVSGTRRRPGSQSSQNSGSAAFVSAPSATLSHSQSASFIAGRRSRQLSAVSASTTGPHLFPAQQTRSGSDSPGSNTSRPDRTSRMMDEEDHTFGFQRPVNWDSVPRLSSAGPSRHVSLVSGPPPLPMPSPEARRSLRPSSSRSTTGASEVTSSQVPLATEVSEAPSTYVTAAPTIESTSEGATVRSYRPLDDFTRDVM